MPLHALMAWRYGTAAIFPPILTHNPLRRSKIRSSEGLVPRAGAETSLPMFVAERTWPPSHAGVHKGTEPHNYMELRDREGFQSYHAYSADGNWSPVPSARSCPVRQICICSCACQVLTKQFDRPGLLT
jgi:hypothetical protein